MRDILRTATFIKWLKKLKDKTGKFLITKRIERLAEGNPGDWDAVGDGLFEMRINHGPGYRVYYTGPRSTDTGTEIIILLCGGNKSTQDADIAKAKKLANMLLEEKNKKEQNDGNNS